MKKMKWWQWGTIQRRLEIWTKALLRGLRYRVALDLEVETGQCDHRRRRIVVNPEAFEGEDDAGQWRATRGLLAHEAGHALFTDTWEEEDVALLRKLVNWLEDQRVERGVSRLYPGVAREFRFLGDLSWREIEADEPPEDGRSKVLCACLVWRWACQRGGHAGLAGFLDLDEETERLWIDDVRPLVEEAWEAATTHEVVAAARRILALLELPPGLPESLALPDWLEDLASDLPVERRSAPMMLPPAGAGDGEDTDSPGRVSDGAAGGDDGEEDGPPMPEGANESPGDIAAIPPAPYLELEARAAPLAAALTAELRPPQPDRRPMPHQWRGRYSFRQEARDEERPFLLGQARAPSPDGLAIQALVDRSGSMYVRMDGVRLAVMALHLACRDLGIPLAVTAFGGGANPGDWKNPLNVVTIQEFGEGGEMSKARVAGLEGHTGAEHLILALRERGPVLAARPERLKLLLVVHDGEPVYHRYPDGADWDLSLTWLAQAHREGLTPIGVLLDGCDRDVERMGQLFGRLIVCGPEELPGKIGNLLRCLV